MLKELVQERLMAAADEIFALFERTIACYEEELSRTREEKERHRRLEAASQTQSVLHDIEADVQQLIGHQDEYPPQLQGWITTPEQEDPQPPRIKAEEDELGITQEDVQQLIGHQEEYPPQPQEGFTTSKQEEPQPPRIKEEENELRITQKGECLLGLKRADFIKLPLTGDSLKTEDHEDQPPEFSRRHHSPNKENGGAEPPSSSLLQHKTTEMEGDHFGAPLSDSDAQDRVEEPLGIDTHCEDMRTHTDKKHSKCSKRKTVGTKWLTCSFCVKSFFKKIDFTRHMRTHTGEKPFTCSVCGRRFTLKSNLAVHMRTHTGEKPFVCSVCGKAFSQKPHLRGHMGTHYRKSL
ncbi:zinc finger protein 875-like isoform X3 [Entelurus aequoreus]|uniref:zinc finger protein 875-like isoform X3 n=1 Tax=Entelurus aequoreus TaxID=161455 RepID=UPI002B1E458A|nr:zinc finger protein 875-like isoform X3 [Entelurus aequoreus]